MARCILSELLIRKVREVKNIPKRSLVRFTDNSELAIFSPQVRIEPGMIFQIIKGGKEIIEFLICHSLEEGKIIPSSDCYFFARRGKHYQDYRCEVHAIDIEQCWQFWIEGLKVEKFIDSTKNPATINVNRYGDILSP